VTRKGLCRACETGIHVAVVLFAVVCHLKKKKDRHNDCGSGFAHHVHLATRNLCYPGWGARPQPSLSTSRRRRRRCAINPSGRRMTSAGWAVRLDRPEMAFHQVQNGRVCGESPEPVPSASLEHLVQRHYPLRVHVVTQFCHRLVNTIPEKPGSTLPAPPIDPCIGPPMDAPIDPSAQHRERERWENVSLLRDSGIQLGQQGHGLSKHGCGQDGHRAGSRSQPNPKKVSTTNKSQEH
jgi:hypothetical protein